MIIPGGGGGGGGGFEGVRTNPPPLPPLLIFSLHARGRACYSQFHACTYIVVVATSVRASAQRSVCIIFLQRKS